ncbi:MAG: sulfotransferase [Devosia sp.]
MKSTTELIDEAWRLLQQNRFPDAIAVLSPVLSHDPENVSAMACVAMASFMSGRDPEGAMKTMERAIALAPEVAILRFNYGMLLAWAGRLEDAAQQFRTALSLRPDDIDAFLQLSLYRRLDGEIELVRAMEAVFERSTIASNDRQRLAFGLAKAFDDLNVPEKAMSYATTGNELTGARWSPRAAEAILVRLRASVAAGEVPHRRASGHPTRAPLFIVGMPRSGTTLIETILSRHPSVRSLGESAQIPDALRAAGGSAYQDASLLGPSRDWLKARAELMMRSWGDGRAAIVTDKLPDNAFAIGAISQLFPNARFIHVRRHPLDNGISNYFTHFEQGHEFTTRLDWIGSRARQVAEVMELWTRVLPSAILDVHYERLVAEPEIEIRRITDFAGLSWTDDFLTHERSSRSAETASKWQVRQPMYKTSVARWRRYEPWLGPMIEAMGGFEWIDAQTDQT